MATRSRLWRRERAKWDGRVEAEGRERPGPFMTVSSRPVERLYDATTLEESGWDVERDLGLPGEYPYTRGVHPTGYRGRPWTIRMFAGFGSAEETNVRFRRLLDDGQTGLSIAFDMPTLMGYDHDDPLAAGEFGKCGVGVSSLADMELLLADLPLDQITTSMTINSPAPLIWGMYIAAAEKRGIDRSTLGGTLQNDILKEYIAQNEYVFPPRPSMRLVTDTVEFASEWMPRWNSISVSGYHIREAGSTAAQELAFTLADGLEYVRWALERGMTIDEFAPRLSFFFNSHNDFFEEIAKFRAARRIWAREIARDVRSGEPALVVDALPHADGGRLADRRAAGSEPAARHDSGAGRGLGWHAIAAHRRDGRSAGAAEREGGAPGGAYAAGDYARVGRDQHRGSSGRVLFRGAADQRHRARGLRVLRADRGAGRGDRVDRDGLLPEGDHRRVGPLPAARSSAATARSWA